MSLSQADAVAKAALDLMLRKRAARQAAGQLADPVAIEKVRVLVTKLGADKIGMGIHIAGIGDAHYEQGEEFDVERGIADSLEDKGWVMITGLGTGEVSTVEVAMRDAAASALASEEALAAQRTAATSAALDAARLELQPAPTEPVTEAVVLVGRSLSAALAETPEPVVEDPAALAAAAALGQPAAKAKA